MHQTGGNLLLMLRHAVHIERVWRNRNIVMRLAASITRSAITHVPTGVRCMTVLAFFSWRIEVLALRGVGRASARRG